MKSKKLVVFLTVLLWITILAISFFAGMRYHKTPITKIEPTQEDTIKENTEYIVEIPISDVESIAKEHGNAITKEEAETLCQEVIGDKAEENGFPISYSCIGAIPAKGKFYYVMHITWLVNNNHWSYIGNCFVSSDGREIYDGFVSEEKYTMTELRWKK